MAGYGGLADTKGRSPLYEFELRGYTACDISDALLKLKVPGAGFIADLNLYCPGAAGVAERGGNEVTISKASTVLFIPKGTTQMSLPRDYLHLQPNIPAGTHWADLTEPGTIVVIRQPDGHKNAVCGGIMALRMKELQARGIVVCGRVRDIKELNETNLPIWATGLSTVGAGASCSPWAIQVPIRVGADDGDTIVCPGDIVFADPINGVVVIPKDKLDEVLDLLPQITTADDKVKSDVLKGMTVREAFNLHRGNL